MSLLPLVRAARWAIADPYLRAIAEIARAYDVRDQVGTIEGQQLAAERRLARKQRRDAAGIETAPLLANTHNVTLMGSTAVIPIDGPIFRRANLFTNWSGGTSTEELSHDIGVALDSSRVESILFLVDSPGGEAKGINELAETIYAARGRKPMEAYVDGDGASGAYWLIAPTDRITLDKTAVVGSIGVVMTVLDPDHPENNYGEIEIVSSMSPMKRPDPNAKEGRAELQTIVDDLGWIFVDAVALYRSMDREAVTAPQGSVLVGQKAVDMSFADALGSFRSALASVQRRAGRTGNRVAQWNGHEWVATTQEVPMPPEADEALQAQLLTQSTDAAQQQLALQSAIVAQVQAAYDPKIAALEERVAALEERNAALTARLDQLQPRVETTEEHLADAGERLEALEGYGPDAGYRASEHGDAPDATLAARQPSDIDTFLTKS